MVLQKHQEPADRLPPPRTLILDFTMTHPRYGRSHLHPIGQMTNIIHYHQLYIDRPDPIAFMPVAVDTSDRIYDDFLRLLLLHAHRETSTLTNDLPEESGACLANIKGSVGLILTISSGMRISIPLDLSSRTF